MVEMDWADWTPVGITDVMALEGYDLALDTEILDDPAFRSVADVRDPYIWLRDRAGEFAWSAQRAVLDSVRDHHHTVVHSCHGAGKMLRLDEPIPTPEGWKANGDLVPGDFVLDENGQPTRVTAVTGTQYRDCYRITFDDNTTMDAGADHQWSVLDLSHRRRGVADWRDHWDDTAVMTTRQIHDAGVKVGGQNRWRIPTARPLDLPERGYTIDPYVLGAWLGDGTTTRPELTIHPDDEVILKRVAETENVRRRSSAKYAWAMTGEHPLGRLTARMQALGVLGAKHIPVEYLRGSAEQRLALLQGLMDTDGFNTGRGCLVGIDLSDERLAADVADLIASLGWKCHTRTGPTASGKTRWRMSFRPDICPFYLPRKALAWVPGTAQARRHTQRTIVNIERIETTPMRCITVDSPRHLFLAGRAYLPTHNSFIASRIIAWWVDTHPYDEVFVISTAPTAAQVAAIMWREVTKVHSKAKLAGKINRAGYPQWYINGELVGYGRKPADHQDSAFQGIHARFVLVVVDEAGGVVKKIYDAIDSIATNEHARVLAIGNPDDPSSNHAMICKPGSGWNVIHIDALRMPNMTYDRVVGPDPTNPRYPLVKALMEADQIPYSTEEVPDDLRELWTDERWVEERIERWAGVSKEQADYLKDEPEKLRDLVKTRTENSALFTAKVRGNFPTSSSEGIIPIGWITRAMERHDDLKSDRSMARSLKAHVSGALTIGVDVARTGNDMSVITIRYGSYVHEIHRVRIEDTILLAEEVAKYMNEPGTLAIIDVIGLGSGVYDYLRKLARDGRVQGTPVAFNASARSGRQDRLGQFQFRNDRAAAWWNMRELLDPSLGSMLALPNDEQLLEELAAPKYSLFQSAIMTVESKDDIKKRLGRSTDSADSVIQSFWIPNTGAQMQSFRYEDADAYVGQRQRGAVLNWDGIEPFTSDDILGKPLAANMNPFAQAAHSGFSVSGNDDVSTWWD